MKSSSVKITGILLAGGMSKRMGREKGTIRMGRRMLFEYPLKALETVSDEVLISAAQPFPSRGKHPYVSDEIKGIGPMGGIHSCLRHSSSDLNIVLSYDMPMVTGELLQYLVQESAHWDVVVPALNGHQIEPLCAIYRKNMVDIFQQLISEQNYAVHQVISRARALILPIEPGMAFYHHELFLNINHMSDLDRLPLDFLNE